MNKTIWNKYGYVWVTSAFFLISLVLHFLFAWFAFVDEQEAHGQIVETSQYWIQTLRDVFENWQSEFLQLIWQVAGLAFLLYVGSPQSKEGDDRKEAKLDAILRSINKREGDDVVKDLDRKYPRK